MKKPITHSVIGLFIILNILDLITTIYLYLRKNDSFNELNPVFILTGNFWVSVIVMKLFFLLVIFIYFLYLKSDSELIRYSTVVIIIVVNIMLFTVVQNNFNLIKSSEETQHQIREYVVQESQRQNITEDKLKINIYKDTVAFPIFKSVFFILLIFILFKKVEKENTKADS